LRAALPADSDSDGDVNAHVPCPGGCGAAYCSPACVSASAQAGHAFLCQNARLEAFFAHSLEHNEIFQLAARAYALLLAHDGERAAAPGAHPFSHFCRARWSDIVEAPAGLDKRELHKFRVDMRGVVQESFFLLERALRPAPKALPEYFNVDFYEQVCMVVVEAREGGGGGRGG
jgi:hypothetical protein